MNSGLGLVTAAALMIVPVWNAPPVAALTPPPIDESALPVAAAPEPPQRTEQMSPCVQAGDDPPAVPSAGGRELEAAWRLTRGAGQTVAVIDTGVARHRLLPHLIPGGDYVATSDGTEDCDGHGTIVAGIIGAASDSTGFSGIAPDATILAIRQSSNRFRPADAPTGSGFGDVDTLAKAIRTAADMGATVINVSSVACLPAQDGLDDRALGAALSYAVDTKNAVVVTAAGNVGGSDQCPQSNPLTDPARPGRPDWTRVNVVVSPAWYDDYVLTVGSVDGRGAPSQFSLAGPWVDVAAPGEHVVSLDPDGEGITDDLGDEGVDRTIAGTSYAAPIVAGIAALVRARSPELTARQVMQRIEDAAHRPSDGWNPVVGHGVVDVFAAVTAGPTLTQAPARQSTPVSDSAPAPSDRRSEMVAVRAAGVCIAVSAAVAASRLRRRPDAVTDD